MASKECVAPWLGEMGESQRDGSCKNARSTVGTADPFTKLSEKAVCMSAADDFAGTLLAMSMLG